MWIILPKSLDFDLIALYSFSSNKWKDDKFCPQQSHFLFISFQRVLKLHYNKNSSNNISCVATVHKALEKIQGPLGWMEGQRGPPREPRGDIWEHQPWGLASHWLLWPFTWDVRFMESIFLGVPRGLGTLHSASMAIFKDSENNNGPKDGEGLELCFCNQWLANQWKRCFRGCKWCVSLLF